MKSHKYWSIGALITMLGTFYTGYKGSKEGHKYFAASSLLCMIMAIYTGHKMITGAVDIDNMYEFASSHCNDFKDLRDDDEIVINREWILNKLAEAENE